jgi:hypothetical protein
MVLLWPPPSVCEGEQATYHVDGSGNAAEDDELLGEKIRTFRNSFPLVGKTTWKFTKKRKPSHASPDLDMSVAIRQAIKDGVADLRFAAGGSGIGCFYG